MLNQSETLHSRNHPDCISTKKHVFHLSFLTFSFAPEVEGRNGLNFQEVTKRNSYTKNMLQKQKLNQEETHQNSFEGLHFIINQSSKVPSSKVHVMSPRGIQRLCLQKYK